MHNSTFLYEIFPKTEQILISMNILEIANISKRYRDKVALDKVSFEMPKGRILGLLGPNGAGKTTLIRIITGINQADEGNVTVDGAPLARKYIDKIGYMPEERGLYKKMKVGEHLIYLARLKNLNAKEAKQRVDGWLEKFDITDWWSKKIDELSKGMQQKIQFIATVINNPMLLILDEPFSGLDPINSNLIKEEINQLNKNGTSVIFSTHRMEQVEEICQDIVLIDNGKIIVNDTLEALKQRYKDSIFEYEFHGFIANSLIEPFEVEKHHGQFLSIRHQNVKEANQFITSMIQSGLQLLRFEERLPTLNDIFIKSVNENHE